MDPRLSLLERAGVFACLPTPDWLKLATADRAATKSEEDRRSHGPFEKGANPAVQGVEWQALPRRRHGFVDLHLLCPGGDGAAQLWIGADEIDRLVLCAEGRRTIPQSVRLALAGYFH
jgi:hypothetical protein